MIYRRRATPLHAARAAAGCAYCGALATISLLASSPFVLVAALVAVVAAGAAAGVGRELRRAAWIAVPLGLLVATINPIVDHNGLTVVARLGTVPWLGELDITLEAVVYGLMLGLRAVVLIEAFALYSAAVDPDEVLRLFRRVSYRSALTAVLATRMVPVLARDARRMAEAQRCRPARPAPRLALVRALAGGALDRAVDVAATLEVRGYGVGAAPAPDPPPVVAPRLRLLRRRRRPRRPGRRRGPRRGGGLRSVPGAAGRRGPGRGAALRGHRRARPGAVRRAQGDRPVSALRVERLTYRYPDAAEPALRDVSLSVEEGELVVVCGLSGSGKSTLLRAACGLVPHFHGGECAGRVVTAGLDTRDHGPGELAVACGALFQDPETQVVMGTVRSELAFPLENRGEGAAAVARGVEEAALALGIAHLLDRPTVELSGGELQRVALAASLAGRPALVVLDEPTSQLDPVAGDELIWLLRRLNEEWGTAILLAEHRLERCLPAADRVIALEGGAVACDARPREFLEWAAGQLAGAADARRPALPARGPAPSARGCQGGAGHAARARAPGRGQTP